MSLANPLWGAPRVDGELPKLAIDVGQTSVAIVHGSEEGRAGAGGPITLMTACRRLTVTNITPSRSMSWRICRGKADRLLLARGYMSNGATISTF
jgi:hypothetical protein